MANDSASQFVNNGGDGTDYSKAAPPPYPGDYNPPVAGPGKDGVDDGKNCGTGATQGGTGHEGNPGIKGNPGGRGGDASQIKFTVDQMIGVYVFATNGGKGGGGQQGGPGGKGQIGGPGGKASSHCGVGAQGPGGPGGVGGDGGTGGNGGDAGQIYITYDTAKSSPPPQISATVTPGNPGANANGGGGGEGGDGNPKGGTGSGGKSPTTNPIPGKGGQVYVNGQPVKSS